MPEKPVVTQNILFGHLTVKAPVRSLFDSWFLKKVKS